MAIELGKAYVQIVPSAKGISGGITNQVVPAADAAGRTGGLTLGKKLAAVASAAGSAVFQNLRGRAGLSVRLQHRGGNSARAGRQPGDALFPARLVGAERRAGPSVCGRVSHGRRRRGNCDGSFAACLMRCGLFLHAQAL